MDNYKKYKYCVVFVGDIDGLKQDVESVSCGEQVGYVESSGLLIATFYSIFTGGELKEYFDLPNEDVGDVERNYIITDLTQGESLLEFKNPTLQTILKVFEDEETTVNVEEMDEEEKRQMIDDILMKGSVISKEDRKILDILSNSLKK
jgi:hypothetical protein